MHIITPPSPDCCLSLSAFVTDLQQQQQRQHKLAMLVATREDLGRRLLTRLVAQYVVETRDETHHGTRLDLNLIVMTPEEYRHKLQDAFATGRTEAQSWIGSVLYELISKTEDHWLTLGLFWTERDALDLISKHDGLQGGPVADVEDTTENLMIRRRMVGKPCEGGDPGPEVLRITRTATYRESDDQYPVWVSEIQRIQRLDAEGNKV